MTLLHWSRTVGIKNVETWDTAYDRTPMSRKRRKEYTKSILQGATSCDVSELRIPIYRALLAHAGASSKGVATRPQSDAALAYVAKVVTNLGLPTRRRWYSSIGTGAPGTYEGVIALDDIYVDPQTPEGNGSVFVGSVCSLNGTPPAADPVGYMVTADGQLQRTLAKSVREGRAPRDPSWQGMRQRAGAHDYEHLALLLAGLVADSHIGIGERVPAVDDGPRKWDRNSHPTDERFALHQPNRNDEEHRPMYWVTGHWTDYTKPGGGRLFGKYERRVWTPGHWAGDPTMGILLDRVPSEELADAV